MSDSGKGALPTRRARWRWRILALFGALAVPAAGLVALARVPPLDLARYEDRSVLVLDSAGGLLRGFTARDGAWRLPARPADVDPRYLRMLLAYEDQRFRHHFGVDPLAVARALWQWARHGRIVSGASTLTMQAARLLEPRPRTLAAKLVEMARAVQLEQRRDKDGVLSLYLTLAPFGGNLEGVRAASLAYLGKEPRRLTAGEAALLVALPRSPTALRPDRFPAAARAARDAVITRMVQAGVLTAQQGREARAEPVPRRRRAMPFHAPHLARRLVAARRAGGADARIRRTTIDGALQRRVEALLRREQAFLDRAATVAVLVVENATRRVVAYAGSADFFDARRAGQVDMVRAVRSPGSTLKPFIYGMGFDDRLIHPETIVVDAPRRFGAYRPENFLSAYHGEVTVREALQQSLNVPAVAVLDAVGPGRFVARLAAAGVRLRFSPGAGVPGLPVALGGAGVTLSDLVTLYAGLANSGVVAPLVYEAEDGGKPIGRPLLSRTAVWYLTRILNGAPPPAAFAEQRRTRDRRRIAFKTGTSYGFRDAWSVGYDAGHTVGVWVGRADGTPSPGRYGRKTAAPILWKLFDLLPEPALRLAEAAPPAGVIRATNAQLPPALRRLGGDRRAARLAIVFPPAGAVVELSHVKEGRDGLVLQAEGGRRPLEWLVNGRPIAAARGRRAVWRPDGEGYVNVAVIDADGRVARAEARLQRNAPRVAAAGPRALIETSICCDRGHSPGPRDPVGINDGP